MLISDVSVRRPVFAAVISLILVIVGLMSAQNMTIREFPDIQRPVVSISTSYRGAASDIVERRVTQILEDQLAGISGITKMSSRSFDERSSITLEFDRDRDVDSVANDVRDRVSRVLRMLPDEADPPSVSKQDSFSGTTMWINVSSDTRSLMEVSDYAERYLVDAFSVVDGVALVRGSGRRRPAMRIWVDPKRLAARGLTVTDIEDALRRENVQIPSGRLESSTREFTLRTDTGFRTVSDFEKLVLSEGADNYLVRLGEVADIELAPENIRSFSRTDGVTGMSLGIVPQAQANILQVNADVAKRVDELQSTLPSDISVGINMDNAIFIKASIREVAKALGLALLLVLIVIYGFIGTIRATIIPVICIPISIISAFIVMNALGFSLNTLTLLGFVLAIGLVVDDAIIVLENIARRIENKEPTLLAATNGTREIGFAVIATTLVLVAVILPISFMPGNIGLIFGEFGISLAAAVCFSSLIALTLVPMLTTKLFADNRLHRGRFTRFVDALFRRLSDAYESLLRRAIRRPFIIILSALAIFLTSLTLLNRLPVEYMPREDRGFAMIILTAPDGASLDYTLGYIKQAERIVLADKEKGDVLRALGRSGSWGGGADVNTGMVLAPLQLWSERERSAAEIVTNWNRHSVTVCSKGCRQLTVPPKQNVPVSFDVLAQTPGPHEVEVSASYEDLEKKAVLTLVRLDRPRIVIRDLSIPSAANYGDPFLLSFTLVRESVSTPQNVTVNIKGGGATAQVDVGNLLIDQEVSINIRSDQLYSSSPNFDIDVSYSDPFGDVQQASTKASISVSNVPWYKRMIGWFIDFF